MAFQPSEMTEATLRRLVDNLARHIKASPLPQPPKRARIQEAVAATLGWPSWHAALATLKNSASKRPPALKPSKDRWAWPQVLDELLRQVPAWEITNHTVSAHALATTVLLSGTEAMRRTAIEALVRENPTLPACLVQGPMSLLSPLHEAFVIENRPARTLLSNGTASQILEMIADLTAKEGASDDMWRSRAIAMLSSVVLALVDLRDHHGLTLDAAGLASSLTMDGLIGLSVDPRLSAPATQSLRAYLRSLPGYKEEREKQGETVREQHGYLQMQFSRVLETLSTDATDVLTASKGHAAARLQVYLPENPLGKAEQALVQQHVQDWVDRQGRGLLVFDVLPVNSPLWTWLAHRMARWQDQGVSVWVGIQTNGDIPSNLFDVIHPRFADQLELRSPRSRFKPAT